MNSLYRRCGHSGILLPRISLGLWHNFGDNDDPETARRTLLTAYEQVVGHFDLANNYGPPPGSAERTLGRILRTDLASHRDELFISTTAGYEMWPGPYGNWGSRKSLMASIDQSLARLGLPYVDLFYIHRYAPLTPLDETLRALVDIVRSGRALYIGISRWPLEALRYAVQWLGERDCPPLIYQGRINLLDRAPIEEGILDFCASAGIGFISFSPLAQGLLTDKYLSGTAPEGSRMRREHFLKSNSLTPELLSRLHRWNSSALSAGTTLARASLRWVDSRPGITTTLIGASSPEQLLDSLQALSAPILDFD